MVNDLQASLADLVLLNSEFNLKLVPHTHCFVPNLSYT